MKRIFIVGVLAGAVLGLNGIAPGSASAAYHCLHARFLGQYDKDGPNGAQCREYLVIPLLFNWDLFLTPGGKEIAPGQICALVEAGEASLFNGPKCGAAEEHKGEAEYEIALQEQWLISKKPIPSSKTVTSKSVGKLLFSDLAATGGATSIECEGNDKTKVGPGANGEVTLFDATSCGFKSGKNGSCEASKPVAVKAIHLPWKTELIPDDEKLHDILSSSGAGNPGWAVECTVIGIFKVQDECTTSEASPLVANVTGGVNITFEASATYTCSLGNATSGMLVGTDLIASPSGAEALSTG